MIESENELRIKLNAETGKLRWQELERHFARGIVIKISAEMDLVDVAVHIVSNDKEAVERWMSEGKIARASIEDAKIWHANNTVFWAVVTAPWVLVQEVREFENNS